MELTGLVWTPSGHEDTRRKITDVTSRIKVFAIADFDGLELGHHYHARTEETFYIVNGKVHFKLEDTRTGKRQEYEVGAGKAINMPLFVAHLLLPDRNARFVGMLSQDFDPADSYKYEIKW